MAMCIVTRVAPLGVIIGLVLAIIGGVNLQRGRTPICSSCGSTEVVPIDSPRGQDLMRVHVNRLQQEDLVWAAARLVRGTATPPSKPPTVVTISDRRPDEKSEAWAQRIEAEELAAFKAKLRR